jgi:hypothetical protein
LQEARLNILTQVISKREQENEAINNEKVERIWKKKLQEREAMLGKIESRRVKGLFYLFFLSLIENIKRSSPESDRKA